MNDYIKTDQQLHWLCQTIAKSNRSFVPSKADDSHTNLYFDELGNRIHGRWTETTLGFRILTINLSNYRIEWLDKKMQVLKSYHSIGKNRISIEEEIVSQLHEMGLNRDGFTNKLHYEIPEYPALKEGVVSINPDGISVWKHYRSLANQACALLIGYLQAKGEIRIWPHHFDTGIYITTHTGMSIGFGLAMSDTLVGGPYFYMSGYPASGKLDYKNLPDLDKGKWEIGQNWSGAVITLTALEKLTSQEQEDALKKYLLKAINWFLKK